MHTLLRADSTGGDPLHHRGKLPILQLLPTRLSRRPSQFKRFSDPGYSSVGLVLVNLDWLPARFCSKAVLRTRF